MAVIFVFVLGSYARPFNWPIQTATPTMQPVRQDRRVSMGVNGDLYFSNVLYNDSVADFCCNARFPYKNVIQQKMPVVVKVLTSEYDCVLSQFTVSHFWTLLQHFDPMTTRAGLIQSYFNHQCLMYLTLLNHT